MPGWMRRLVDLGVPDDASPAQARRTQTINLIAGGAIALNAVYNLLPLFVGFEHIWPAFITNLVSIGLNVVVLWLNAARRTKAAMYLSLAAALLNLVVASLVLGLGTGVWLFLFLVPAVGVLVAPAGSIRTQIAFAVSGLAALVGVIVAQPTGPPAIAGTGLETALMVTSVVGTVAVLTLIGIHHQHVVDTAEADLQEAHGV